MRPQVNHGFDSKAHSWFRHANSLVLCVMWYIRRTVEQLVNAVATIAFNDTAVPALRMLLNRITRISEQHPGFYQLNRLIQAFSRGLHNSDGIGVRQRLVSNVIGFVQITVEAIMVQSDINIDNIAVLQRPLVRNSVADGLVDRRAYRLGELYIIQR